MDKLKFALFSVVVLTLLGLVSYWAIVSLQSGTQHVTSQKLAQLQKENGDLKKEVKDLADKLSAIQPEGVADTKGVSPQQPETAKPKPAQTVYKYQDLINELQKLIDDNVSMKLKSSGTRVGTVQKFLNLYNKTSTSVDNDFGVSTQNAVMAFQKANGLTADGEASTGTFSKIIDWLKKQG